MESSGYNPEMLMLARENQGMSQKELAKAAGMHQSHISRYENGTLALTREAVLKFVPILKQPEEFFRQTDQVFSLGSSFLFHRKRQSLATGAIRQLQAEINIMRMRIDRLIRGLEVERVNEFVSYEIGEDGSPEEIARRLRGDWRVPSGPIRNLTKLIEKAGGIVIHYPFTSLKIDGLSVWASPTPPLFFLNKNCPPDRTRWTGSHELGHTVMHRYLSPEIEEEADRFASEFLMPANDIKDDLYNMTLPKAASLKLTWRVSMQAIIRRAKDLEAISPSRYTSLCVQMSRSGMRTREPNPIPPEFPENLPAIFRIHTIDHKYSLKELSDLMVANISEIEWMFPSKDRPLRLAK